MDISANQESVRTFDGEDKAITSWPISLAQQVISLVISVISRVGPLVTKARSYMSHQVHHEMFMLT